MIDRLRDVITLDRVFWVSLILKALDGLLESIGGILLLFISPQQIGSIAHFLTQHELAQDHKDFVATHLVHYANAFTSAATLFAAIYLLAHGVVKVVLVVAVLKGKTAAYPWMIAFLVAFIIFQLYQIAQHFSLGLVFLTLFDAFIVWLTLREYKIRRKEHLTAPVAFD